MIMSTPSFYESAISMVESGDLDESFIDDAVLRVLKVKMEMGLFGERRSGFHNITKSIMACEEHLKLNSDFTDQTVVMLENKDNTLPLQRNIKKIAVVGPNANSIPSQYGDWTFFTHPLPDFTKKPESVCITIWDGTRELAGRYGAEVVLSEWDGPVSVYRRGDDPNPQDTQSLHRAAEDNKAVNKKDMKKQSDLPDYAKMLQTCEGADVVIAVIGDDPTFNGEERDRANLDLPYSQQKMLETLKEAGHKLIIVGVTGKPLTIKWAKDNADAMLWTFCPGMFGGSAVAGVLSGDINPSARLPISFPQHVGQVPVYYNQLPGWHGEKYIDLPKEPLYTFGYGLSYSDFEFANLNLPEKVSADSNEDIIVSVDVTNRSKIDGTSVVQLYFRDVISSLSTPVKQFKDFKRVLLKAGETKTVKLKIPMNELALVNHNLQRVIEKGAFVVYVGDGVYLEKEFLVC